MNIPWKDPAQESPKEGEKIIALSWHWKKCFPGSLEIMGGEVSFDVPQYAIPRRWRVETNDESGLGLFCRYQEDIDAWCYADEFLPAFPEFLELKGRDGSEP